MIRTEKHIISPNNSNFLECDRLCFLSKNLFNYANYIIRQKFIETSKLKEQGLLDNAIWIRYNELEKEIMKHQDYTSLPNNSSQKVLQILDKNWKGFFESLKSYKRNPDKFLGKPKLPGYKDKTKGRNIVVFTCNQFKRKGNKINFPLKSGLKPITTKLTNEKINQVRIVPFKNNYKIEIVYEKLQKINDLNITRVASIDLGINNLCSLTSNIKGFQPILINGRTLKSMNQYYNKKKSKIQSELKIKNNKDWSKKLTRLNIKRDNKIENYLHKASKKIVEILLENKVKTLIIGYNPEWKQDINIGKKNNQTFVMIPYQKLISFLIYKCEEQGIEVKTNEESYTSKCSALDLEEIGKQEVYLGKRVKRGLFKTCKGNYINADINGSLNILRKVIGNDFLSENPFNRGLVVNPIKLSLGYS